MFSRHRTAVLTVSYFLVFAIGITDTFTGYEIKLSLLYFIPIAVVTWYTGNIQGLVICIVSTIVELVSDKLAGTKYSHPLIIYWNAASKFFTYFILSGLMIEMKYNNMLEQMSGELKRSNEELDQFTSVISHDLKQPLRVIANYLQLLERRTKDKIDPGAKVFITGAVNEANKIYQLINELLDYSRLGGGNRRFAPANLSEILGQALEKLKASVEDSGAVVTADPLPNLPVVGSEIVRVFQNLIDNAIKFRGMNPPRIHVSAKGSGNEWIFSVRDAGIGIEPQYHQTIFKMFQRLHTKSEYPGTGLGLAICKKIIESHSGRIWVESAPGNGSTFFFTIPYSSSVPEQLKQFKP